MNFDSPTYLCSRTESTWYPPTLFPKLLEVHDSSLLGRSLLPLGADDPPVLSYGFLSCPSVLGALLEELDLSPDPDLCPPNDLPLELHPLSDPNLPPHLLAKGAPPSLLSTILLFFSDGGIGLSRETFVNFPSVSSTHI